jgi:malate dehydrogenase (oxaloacetate-decarboxylating)(NADP+)
VVSGAGAAALACLDLIVDLGFPLKHLRHRPGRRGLQGPHGADGPGQGTLRAGNALRTWPSHPGADIFLGLSAGGVLKQDMVRKMAPKPLILALANPNPEILPEEVKAVRDDAIIATGRSDYPNQVNNVLCFPTSSAARSIAAPPPSREIAVVHAIADLAHAEQSDIVATAYGISNLSFGPNT